jgi:polysaccharide pyruvyl transferase WcaK-like protein
MKIAHFGTFDVDNYGDLLFPHIARFRYPKAEWIHISPTNHKTSFSDALPTLSFEEAITKKFDLVLIGGGNIIHSKPTSLNDYKNVATLAYPSLWIGATELAIAQKIPVKYNAPGLASTKLTFIEKNLYKKAFSNSNYLSFRDADSQRIASQYTTKDITIIPDTAFDIAKMWPITNNPKRDYIIINLNERYHKPINTTAKFIDKISSYLKLPIKLCIIGNCHGDLDFTTKVKNELKCENELIATTSLKSLAHLIGNAKIFIGSSMHGFITALSYKTPSLLVLNNKPMHKFKGLLDVIDVEHNVICSSWEEVLKRINSPASLTDESIRNIEKKLDEHWKNIFEKTQDKNFNNNNLLKGWKMLLVINNIPNSIKKQLKKIYKK